MTIYWIIFVCFAGGLTSLFLASLIFKKASPKLITNMVSLAVGTLLTTAFLVQFLILDIGKLDCIFY